MKKRNIFTWIIAYLCVILFTFYCFSTALPKLRMMLFILLFLLCLDCLLWIKRANVFLSVENKFLRAVYILGFFFPSLLLLGFDIFLLFKNLPLWPVILRTYWFGLFEILFVCKLIITSLLILGDFINWIRFTIRKHKISKLKEIKNMLITGYIIAILFFGLCLYGVLVTTFKISVKQITLEFEDLPTSFDGYKIVQISDIHIGSFDEQGQKPLKKAIAVINKQAPDIVVFTGDMVNYSASEAIPFENTLKAIRAKDGVLAIRGNHDYANYLRHKTPQDSIKDVQDLEKFFTTINWQLLKNEHKVIYRNNDSIVIAGVEFWGEKENALKLSNTPQALNNIDSNTFIVMLAHAPSYFKFIVSAKYPQINLTLSGDTHGSQIGITYGNNSVSPLSLTTGYWKGLYKADNQYLYINVGLGFNGLPFRIGIRPEITVITLKNKNK